MFNSCVNCRAPLEPEDGHRECLSCLGAGDGGPSTGHSPGLRGQAAGTTAARPGVTTRSARAVTGQHPVGLAQRVDKMSADLEEVKALLASLRPQPAQSGSAQGHTPAAWQPGCSPSPPQLSPASDARGLDVLSIQASESMDCGGSETHDSTSPAGSQAAASEAGRPSVQPSVQPALKTALARLGLDTSPVAQPQQSAFFRGSAQPSMLDVTPSSPYIEELQQCWADPSRQSHLPTDCRALAAMRDASAYGLQRMPGIEPSVAALVPSPNEALRPDARKSSLVPCQVTNFLGIHLDSRLLRASLEGWGAVWQCRMARGCWSSQQQRRQHINMLELQAVFLGLQHFLTDLAGRHVLVRTDNSTVVYYINHQGDTRSLRCLRWAHRHLLSLRAVYLPGAANRAADLLSRRGPDPGEWRLNPAVVPAIWERFGRAEVDLFAVVVDHHTLLLVAPRWPGSVVPTATAAAERSLLDLCEPAVADTIASSRAASTNALYANRWKLFSAWCLTQGVEPTRCPLPTILLILQSLFDKGLTPSTIKVYAAAISAQLARVDGQTVGSHPLVAGFLKGALRLRQPRRSRVPKWDLPLVLQALCDAPFEPLLTVDVSWLSMKTAFLLAITSAKRVGELHALSVSGDCLRWHPGDSGVTLWPNPSFLPKTLNSAFVNQPLTLAAFEAGQGERSDLLCPVRALQMYVSRTEGFRLSDALFLCHTGPRRGLALSKQRLSKWVAEAILDAYRHSGSTVPRGVRAHFTRSMAASWASLRS
ncbi:hypothetical protein ACEWY4_007830 [Coilia grayii]|uniref:RNase H type-1 domain-containing protein n=1 Tax=Coilia grayii TaxID=363190 RepID=A0ABD1K964_9TELE